jgi:hypothetical protein
MNLKTPGVVRKGFARLSLSLMKRSRKWAALTRRALIAGVGSAPAWFTQCDYTEYPLEPTFCDEWCRVLLRSNCEQEPENCVRNCERSTAPRECLELQDLLLGCYQAASAGDFVCSGQGFQQIARPEERVCQGERDALIACAYPDVKFCLDVCRAAEASQAGDAASDAEPPPGRTCPSRDIPCDSLCWLAPRVLGGPREGGLDASSDASGADASAGDGGSGIVDLVDELVACALGRAEACRSEPADAGDAGDANWSSVLLDCAEELGF